MEHTIVSPLSINRPRSKPFYLNLNVYRNTHYKSLNSMKKKYKQIMTSQVSALPSLGKIRLTYTLYPKTRRLCDVSNICSVVDKFFSDCLTELGKIEDDNYKFVPEIKYTFGCIDKEYPRVEIKIEEI